MIPTRNVLGRVPPWLWLALLLTLWLAGLGLAPLIDVDEGAFSEATREMLASGDWGHTTLNGADRFDKPILIYWFQAASMAAFSVNVFAVRLPSAIAALMWCLAALRFEPIVDRGHRVRRPGRSIEVTSQIAQGDPDHTQLAVIGPRTPRDLAPVTDAGLGRVARQFGKLEASFEAFFEGQALIVRDRLQRLALAGELLHQLLDHLVAVYGAFLSHGFFPFPLSSSRTGT